MLILSRRGFTGSASAAFLLLVPYQTSLGAQEVSYESVQPTQAELVPVAAALAQASPQISRIWPGFWTSDQSFFLVSPRGGMLLVAAFSPPAEYTPLSAADLPAVIAGRAYARDGTLPGSRPGTFPGMYEISGRSVYALPPMGSTLVKRLSFYTHEAFHFHQRQSPHAWVSTAEDTIMGLSPAAYLREPGVVNDSTFRAGLRREDELLRRIATEQDQASLRELLQVYLTARTARLRDHPDVLAIERRYERREGTAEYVGCRVATLVANAQEALHSCVVENLGDENPDNPVLQFLRWRPYSVGAVLSLALDRLEVPSWKDAVAVGEHLDRIVSRVAAPPTPSN